MVDTNLLTLIHYSICLGCLCFTLYASSILLFKKPKKNLHIHTRTPIVYLYFWFTASSSVFLMINAAYILAWWRPGQSLYNPMILYYVAGFPTIYVNFVPVADFFLCADRCFSVAFPTQYQKLFKTILAWIFVICVVGIFILYIVVTNWFAFTTNESTTTCAFYICLVYLLKYPLIISYTKYVFCSLNVVAAAALLILNHLRKSSQKDLIKKINHSVFILSILNIAFSFSPGLIAGAFLQVN